MKTKLTERGVQSLACKGTEHLKAWDTEIAGFVCRVTRGGSKTFVFDYRVGRSRRQIKIGSHPGWTVAAARKRAQALRVAVDEGRDPKMERDLDRSAPLIRDLHDRMVDDYARLVPRARSDRMQMWRTAILPAIGTKRVDAVTFADIEAIHLKKTRAGHPYAANRIVEVLRHALKKAVQWGMRSDNPADGIKRNREEPKQRFLTMAEYPRFFAALDNARNQTSADALRLLVYTGARMSEVLTARWDQFDLDAGIWVKPAAMTKQRRLHRIPLSRRCRELLHRLAEERSGDVLFPGKGATGTQTELRKTFRRACEEARIEDLRIHDLRHSFASAMISSDASLPEVGAMLGHSQPQTTQRYAHLHDEALRAASDRTDAFLDRTFNATG